MSDVVEISSDSEDTIILTECQTHDYEKLDIENIVNKYILNNDSSVEDVPKANLKHDASFSDDDLIAEPLSKRLKSKSEVYPRTNSENTDFPANAFESNSKLSTERDTGSVETILQSLSKKYSEILETSYTEHPIKQVENSPKKTCLNKEQQKQEKEAVKLLRIEERTRKKLEAEREKAVKQVLTANNKNLKPEECMKFVQVHVDNAIINETYGKDILAALQIAQAKYKVESQIFSNTISWTRNVQSHLVDDNGKLALSSEVRETDEVLLIMNCNQFIEHVKNNTLCGHVQSLKSVLVNKKISLALFGLQSYFRFQKNQKKNDLRSQIVDDNKQTKTDKRFKDVPKVSRRNVEYALTELQLLSSCSYRMVDSSEDLGLLVAQFTKAIVQLPYKLQKQEKYEKTDWFAAGENKSCIKVDKDGNGLQRLWNQILTTFPLARLETAEAISSVYPTPSALIQAYENCKSKSDGEFLLQNIPIRRAAGPLSSVRKIGPELSKKIYNFFTAVDGDVLL